MGKDLRKYRRLDWNRLGTITTLTGEGTIQCFVKDISPNGARLKVAEPLLVPDYFRLHYGIGELMPKCSVRWRRGNEIGVEFLLAI